MRKFLSDLLHDLAETILHPIITIFLLGWGLVPIYLQGFGIMIMFFAVLWGLCAGDILSLLCGLVLGFILYGIGYGIRYLIDPDNRKE